MKPHVKFGLIGAGAMIIWTLIGYVVGNDKMEAMKWPGYFVMLGIMIYTMRGAILERKTMGGGFITFGKAFGVAMLTSLVTWFVSSIFTFIYFRLLNPEALDKIREITIAEYEKRGMTEEQIAQAMPYMEMFTNPLAISVMAFVVMMFYSVLLGLIMAGVLKKDNPNGMLDSVN